MLQELPCGHFMHSHCFAQYTRYNYSCPVCSKSMGDMSIYFGMLDSIVARDLADLPPAYRSRQQVCPRSLCLAEAHSDGNVVGMACQSSMQAQGVLDL